MIDERRRLVRGAADPPRHARRALALSGGGIRSATFSLGVLQAVAEARSTGGTSEQDEQPAAATFKDSLLSTFDYLSTVSGGGYVGSFLCSLFIPGRLRPDSPPAATPGKAEELPQDAQAMQAAADDVVRVLTGGIPGRIRSRTDYSGDGILQAPLAWLRENGRYLTPSSSGDGVYAAALALRNWVAVHCVIGTLVTSLVAFIVTARAGLARLCPWYRNWERELFERAEQAGDAFSVAAVWWSTLSVASVLPLATIGVGLGAAYWLVEGPDGTARGKWWPDSAVVMFLLGIAGIIGGLRFINWEELKAGTRDATRLAVLVFLGVECLLACVCLWIARWRYKTVSQQRVALTRGLKMMLVLSVVLAGLALVDTLGQTIYLAATRRDAGPATLSPAALALALVWLARRLSAKEAIRVPAFVRKLPLSALAGFAGVAIFVLVGGLWAAFVQWVAWGGDRPDAADVYEGAHLGFAALTFAIALLLAFLNGFFPGFINMSSLQAFYAARLTRAYLGASNGKRFGAEAPAAARSAAEPIESDRVTMSDYYRNHSIRTLAPLHIINVTVGKTVDPAEQLVQRDRKGQPLAVLPCGIALDTPRVGRFPKPSRSRGWCRSSVERELDVGEWVATSGAAVSTAIGRRTSLGFSLLLGAANIRLGTWWPTGRGRADTVRIPLMPKFVVPRRLRRWTGAAFKTQRYLSYELRAAFHGTHRQWQYLSDGGHFENTGIYELLRAERDVGQIFACDNGADPDYEFADLANLIRLAKIDLRIEIRIVDPATIDFRDRALAALEGLFGSPRAFRRARPEEAPAALLLYADSPGRKPVQIVVVKPRVGKGAPADVLQYAATHLPFPQQPTADQFFDEGQWESYRALGYWQGRRVFTPQVLAALEAHGARQRT